jgi:hypothetical protein
MHPTHQGVTMDFEQYDKLKDVDKVLPTLLPELKNMLLCQFTHQFPLFCVLSFKIYSQKTNVTFVGMCREGRYA